MIPLLLAFAAGLLVGAGLALLAVMLAAVRAFRTAVSGQRTP